MAEARHRVASACGLAAAALGVLGILGWVTPWRVLGTFDPGSPIPMAASAGVGFVALGLAMALEGAGRARRLVLAIAVTLLVASLVHLAQVPAQVRALNPYLDLDLRSISLPRYGIMSPAVALVWFFVAVGLLGCRLERQLRLVRVATGPVGGLLAAIGSAGALGYIYRAPDLYRGLFIPLALPTALAIAVLGTGLVALAPADGVPLRWLLGTSAQARLLRAFLPLAPAVLAVDAALSPLGLERVAPSLHQVLGAALSALVVVVVVAFASRGLGRLIDRAEQDRERARRAEQALQEQRAQARKLEAVGRLAGGVAHDFNNLLGVIVGHAEHLRSGLGGAQRERLELILAAAHRGAGLTRDLLAVGQRQLVMPRPLDLGERVGALEPRLREAVGASIELRIAAGQAGAWADPEELEELLLRLCTNARDAMPDGGRLEITTSAIELAEPEAGALEPIPPGRYALLQVADTGAGIAPEALPNLFEPFYSSHALGPGRARGLGLAAVYGIAKRADGYVSVASEVGRGSRFRVYLPSLDAAPEASWPAVAPAEPAAAAPGARPTVLLAEDEPELRDIVREMLEGEGFEVVAAEDGRQAAELAEGRSIDVVVTDVVMPGLDGRALVEALAARGQRPGVVFVSGYTDDILGRSGGLPAGAAFLGKPFSAEALVREVRRTLAAGR